MTDSFKIIKIVKRVVRFYILLKKWFSSGKIFQQKGSIPKKIL